MENSLRTDELKEAIFSLEMVAEQVLKIHIDTYRWKWVIIALHNAVQGFMVLSLKGSHGLNILKNADKKSWLNNYLSFRKIVFHKSTMLAQNMRSLCLC